MWVTHICKHSDMYVCIYIYLYVQYMIMIAIPQRIGIPVKSNPKIVIKWHKCKVCMFFWCFLGPWIKAGSTCGDDCPKHSPSFQWFRRELPSGNGWHSYWKCWFIVDLPIENGDFPVRYVNVYQRVNIFHGSLQRTADWESAKIPKSWRFENQTRHRWVHGQPWLTHRIHVCYIC